MGQATRSVCVFCEGLRREPPGTQQFMVRGEQVWLHLHCRAGYERATNVEIEPHEQARA